MHIKFLSHGTGDPHKAVTYLLSKHDHTGAERPEVKVLLGNPRQLADLAQSLPFVHRYSSAVIAWHPNDKPTMEEVMEVVADFERLAFAGFNPDQYSIAAVWHGGHIHILAARVELQSGKSHNIAPPAGKKAFDHLRDYWNFRKGWARPDDPKRARLYQPGAMVMYRSSVSQRVNAQVLRSALDAEPDLQNNSNRKIAIAEWIKGRVLTGEIHNREGIVAALSELGVVGRVGADYVSITLSADQSKLRFKGELFSASFDGRLARSGSTLLVPVVGAEMEHPNPMAAEAAKRKLDAMIIAREAYNKRMYPASEQSLNGGQVPAHNEDQETVINFETPRVKTSYDRNRNPLVATAFESFEAARNAVRSLIDSCRSAIATFAAIEQASNAAERASYSAERARAAAMIELERSGQRGMAYRNPKLRYKF